METHTHTYDLLELRGETIHIDTCPIWQLKGLTRFTLELSLAVPKAGTAHHVTVVCLAVPLLPDAIVVAVVMAPL